MIGALLALTTATLVGQTPSAGVDARIAIAGDLVVTASGRNVRVHSDFGEDVTTTIPCDAVDVVAHPGFGEAEWAVLCADRVVWHHGSSVTEISLDRRDATAFAMSFVFGRAVVGYGDGTVELYPQSGAPRIAHYGHRILGLAIEGIDDVTAFTDEPCDTCRAVALDAAAEHSKRAWVGGRVRDDVKHGGILVDPDVADVAMRDGKLCVTRGTTFTCEARSLDEQTPAYQEPPLDVLDANLVRASAFGVAGLVALTASPFVLAAFGSSTTQALAVAGLVALGGGALALGVAAAGIGVALVIMAASPEHVGTDGSCVGDAVSTFGNAVIDCVSAVALTMGVVLVAVSAALIAGGVVAVVNAAPADRALGGKPAADPFWPAFGGAALGGALGLAGTLLVEGSDDALGSDQRFVDGTAANVAAFGLVFGGAALGGAVGYGLGEAGRGR